MHEVGSWFVYLIDLAVLCILGMIALVLIFLKKGTYQKEAEGCVRAEIELPTGWAEYHIVPCEFNAKSVVVDNFEYLLHPKERRYGKHPMKPFMGISWLQVPIRRESWYLDNAEPIRKSYEEPVATAKEINAMRNEMAASTAAMEIEEIKAQSKVINRAIANQPNKWVVYGGIGGAILLGFITLVVVFQLAW